MGALMKVLGAIGIADAIWSMAQPRRWLRARRRLIRRMGRRRGLVYGTGAAELALGAYLLKHRFKGARARA